jgi:hypothetical protein
VPKLLRDATYGPLLTCRAAALNRSELLKILIASGSDVERPAPPSGQLPSGYPLLVAAQSGAADCVAVLVAQGVNTNVINAVCDDPIHTQPIICHIHPPDVDAISYSHSVILCTFSSNRITITH